MGGFANNAPIVTDGLVFYVDAGNSKSYDGVSGGATWTDLVGGNNGTLTNTDTNPASGSYVYDSGNGGSLVFDGSNDFTSFSTAPLDFSSTNFSVEAIFKTTTSGVDVILGQYPGGGDWWLGVNSSKLQFSISLPSSKVEPKTTFNVNDNQWRIATATVSNSTYEAKLYVDGSLVDTQSGTGSYPNSSNNFTIGKFGDSNFQFPGSIAGVKIYNKVLTPSEVLQNYNALKNRFV